MVIPITRWKASDQEAFEVVTKVGWRDEGDFVEGT